MRVVVTGATGFIGRALVEALQARGDTVIALSRNAAKARAALGDVDVHEWHGKLGPWAEVFSGADAVINLAGEPVAAHPWTPEEKQRILQSRVDATRLVVDAIAQADPRPRVLINASAIGFYGERGAERLTEESAPGEGFFPAVVRAWEYEAQRVQRLGVRLVLLRTGFVLGQRGSLAQMALPFQLFGGGVIGPPDAWLSWIHLEDEVGIILWALDDPRVHGVINATAPNPVTLATFSRQLGRALGRPVWFPFLRQMIGLVLGERGRVMLASERVLPQRAQELGYQFHYPDSEQALRAIAQQGLPVRAPLVEALSALR